jgi:hypothetical protein
MQVKVSWKGSRRTQSRPIRIEKKRYHFAIAWVSGSEVSQWQMEVRESLKVIATCSVVVNLKLIEVAGSKFADPGGCRSVTCFLNLESRAEQNTISSPQTSASASPSHLLPTHALLSLPSEIRQH